MRTLIGRTMAAALLAVAVWATAGPPAPPPPGAPFRHVNVILPDGAELYAGRVDGLCFCPDASELVVGDGDTQVRVPRSEIVGWRYFLSDDMTVGADDSARGDAPSLMLRGDALVLSGFASGTPVRVTALDGTVAAARAVSASPCEIDLGAIPAGVYIVRAGTCSLKIIINR